MTESKPTLGPYFSYTDAAAAAAWLSEVFRFGQVQAYSTPEGGVMHAETSSGGGEIMLGTADPSAVGDATSPTDTGSRGS